MDSFYLTLNSNADGEFSATNSSASFKTHLGKMITLENNWEVALTELRLPMTVPNLPQEICRVIGISHESVKEEPKVYTIKSDYYETADALIGELNMAFMHSLKFSIEKTGCLRIDTENFGIYTFHPMLSDILGLNKSDPIGNFFDHKGIKPINLRRSVPSTFNINTDIIEHQLVDNTHNDCLRSVSAFADNYKYGFDKHYNFQRLHYKKVRCNRLEYININITDGYNNPVSFLSRDSSVQLHFRRGLE